MEKRIALAGNPNVGKSTLFNSLTGMKQHTGNWAGKTVGSAAGSCSGKYRYEIYDLPGTYSLQAVSAEEAVAGEFLLSGKADGAAVVCDATALQRNMNLLLELSECCERLLVIVNMMDEAEKRGISFDAELFSKLLSRPVVALSAKDSRSREQVIAALDALMDSEGREKDVQRSVEERFALARDICGKVLQRDARADSRDRKLDRILCGKAFAFPIMLLLLMFLFYLSIRAANYPSALLMEKLLGLEPWFLRITSAAGLPQWLCQMLCCGAYRTLAWVVSVMLPPMAVFFPLFTLLEDWGYLPRIAYNLDRPFQCCGSCGKQALTMCMGFGCNAAAVVNCRIIDSEKQRRAAMLTNAFIPCNGRFPAIIALISIFAFSPDKAGWAAAALTGFILFGIAMSLLFTKLINGKAERGASGFVLELPPYRKPQITQVLLRSLLDRSLFVLGRAAAVAAPAGALIWLLANLNAGEQSLIEAFAAILEPIGAFAGMDGVIIAAFILGLPANEIVLPIILMIYGAGGGLSELSGLSETGLLLRANGWGMERALCVAVLMLCHPCSTTLLSVKKESGSTRLMLLAWLIPNLTGYLICVLISAVV